MAEWTVVPDGYGRVLLIITALGGERSICTMTAAESEELHRALRKAAKQARRSREG